MAVLVGALPTTGAHAAGETRTLSLYNIHTKAELNITYKRNGRFDDEALATLNHFLRDWRKEQEVRMDPQLFDLLWTVHTEVKAKGPIHIVCGYRSPGTNEMLRSRSGGVAKTSLHMQGKAIDFSIPSAEVADVRAAALRVQGGGVGYYPTSGIPFVHMDVGNVRHWPRMTHDQLARVFPNGRTLHVPTDGNPLPGYELALADQERGALGRGSQPKAKSLIASLFGGSDPEESADATASAAPAPNARTAARRAAPAAAPETTVAMTNVPLPNARPQAMATYQVASASATSVPAPAPAANRRAPMGEPAASQSVRPVNLAALSPNQVIFERGYWQGLPEPAAPPSRRVASLGGSAVFDSTVAAGRNDRVPADVALAYAADVEGPTSSLSQRMIGFPTGHSESRATVTNNGSASVALKPATLSAEQLVASASRPLKPGERADNPWVRGLIMTPSVTRSMTTTTFGAPDMRSLQPFMHKPGASVMMTFSADPHLGLSTDSFTGSAVVFQATVTFGMRTASLHSASAGAPSH